MIDRVLGYLPFEEEVYFGKCRNYASPYWRQQAFSSTYSDSNDLELKSRSGVFPRGNSKSNSIVYSLCSVLILPSDVSDSRYNRHQVRRSTWAVVLAQVVRLSTVALVSA